jgi:hypothetical protein
MRLPVIASVLWVFCVSAAGGHSATATAYDTEDAYQIYSLLIPPEEAYDFAKGTLVIHPLQFSSRVVGGTIFISAIRTPGDTSPCPR